MILKRAGNKFCDQIDHLLLVEITVRARDGRDKYHFELHKNNEFDKRYEPGVDNKVYSEWDHWAINGKNKASNEMKSRLNDNESSEINFNPLSWAH